MALHEPFDERDATHRVVTRQPAGVDDTGETGWITVENRVVDVTMRFGTAVHLSLDEDADVLEDVRGRLDRVPESERVLSGTGPEYRATLPDDAAVVREAIAVESDDTDAWVARVFALEEFVVRTADAWCYRSVPHHAHVRELNAAARDGLLAAVGDALESMPRAAVVPIDGLASWRSNGDRYELSWDALRRHTDRCDSSARTAFDLDRLRRVRPLPDRRELLFRWAPPSPGSRSRRILRRLLASGSAEPPTRLAFPDRETLLEVVDALETLRDAFEYPYAIDSSGQFERD